MALKLTTVKLLEELYKEFKTISFEKEFTLQKLVNSEFKKTIEEHRDLKPSGSNL